MERHEYLVKGTGIQTKFEYVRQRFGEAGLTRLRDALSGRIAQPVLVTTWYTFDQYEAVLVTIAELFYRGNLSSLREVGAYSAQKLLTSVYQAYRNDGDIGRFVSRLPSLYERFYNCGKMTIDFRPERSFCGFRFTGAPVYVASDLEVAIGFTKQCWSFAGYEAVISGLAIESEEARFVLMWHKAPNNMRAAGSM